MKCHITAVVGYLHFPVLTESSVVISQYIQHREVDLLANVFVLCIS